MQSTGRESKAVQELSERQKRYNDRRALSCSVVQEVARATGVLAAGKAVKVVYGDPDAWGPYVRITEFNDRDSLRRATRKERVAVA